MFPLYTPQTSLATFTNTNWHPEHLLSYPKFPILHIFLILFSFIGPMKQPDLVLLHAPSVYDFRDRPRLFGPVSDLIPSSPVFEMYPIGFATMTAYLEKRGWHVRIVNLAYRMMRSNRFDPRTFLRSLRPEVFGLDLHWLPHAHGSLEVARILKQLHPRIPVVFGGLSASYFSRELAAYNQVDYVLRGAMSEEPMRCLLEGIRGDRELEEVPNLTWDDGGQVRVSGMEWEPDRLDDANLRPDVLMRQAVRYADCLSITPYDGWWQDPVMPVMTVKGCTQQCVTCGGACSGFARATGQTEPVYRSPMNVIKNVRDIAAFSRGPIFLIGDPRQPGREYAQEVLRLLRRERIDNEFVFELFSPASCEFLADIDRSVSRWTLELSPESHDPTVRHAHNQVVQYSNREMEETIRGALDAGCRRVDIFYMIGLRRQTVSSVMDTVEYAGGLLDQFDSSVSCYISPLGPFLDPGSAAFERPQEMGYRVLARSLEEHRRLLEHVRWRNMLNYETEWLDRDQIVDVTYRAGERLNELKLEHGRVTPAIAQAVADRIEVARKLEKHAGRNERIPRKTAKKATNLGAETVADEGELAWRRCVWNFRPLGIGKLLLGL